MIVSLICASQLNIAEDLGMVAHVFSDKTGTLTDNIMTFRACAIRGVPFSFRSRTAAEPAALVRDSAGEGDSMQINAAERDDFLIAMTLCNTVIPIHGENAPVVYEGESRDEVALVEAAAQIGCVLASRSTRRGR